MAEFDRRRVVVGLKKAQKQVDRYIRKRLEAEGGADSVERELRRTRDSVNRDLEKMRRGQA